MQHVARKLSCWGLALLPLLGLPLLGCSGGDERAHAAALDADGPPDLHQVAAEPCSEPDLGCPCEEEGVSLECGTVTEQRGAYRICSPGERLCAEGVWGDCLAAGPGIVMAAEAGTD